MTKKPNQPSFNAKEAIVQAERDFAEAVEAEDILDAVSRGVWIKDHQTEPQETAIATPLAISLWYSEFGDNEKEDFIRAFAQNDDMATAWAKRWTEKEMILEWPVFARVLLLALSEPPTLRDKKPGNSIDVEGVIKYLRTIGTDMSEEADKPLSQIVRAWQNRPRTIETASVSVSGGTRLPYRASEFGRNQWHEVQAVDAVEIDGVPYAVKMAEIGTPVFPDYETARKSKKPVLYASTGEPIDQLSLAFTTPRKPIETPIALIAFERFGWDLRKSLACDCAFLMKIVLASNQSLLIPKHEGAQLLARSRDGGYRRVFESDEQRFEIATKVFHDLVFWIDDGGVFRWFPMLDVTKDEQGRAIMQMPPWYKSSQYTITGGLVNAHTRMQGQINDGGIWRTVDAMEYYLARSAPVRHGKFAGIANALTPANGKTGPGQWEKLTRDEFFRLTGDNTHGVADGTLRKRFFDRKNRLKDAGYITAGNRPAEANDTVEFQSVHGGVWVRATDKGVESAKKAQRGHIETRSLNEILGNPIKV